MAKRHKGKLELDWVDKGDIIVTIRGLYDKTRLH